MQYESEGDTNHNWCTQYSQRKIDKGTGGLGIKRTNGDHPNNSIPKNTEKNSGYLLSDFRCVKNSERVK